MLALHVSLVSNRRCFSGGRKSNEDALKERRRVSGLFSMMEPSLLQFYVSRQWLNKFKTFAEPGPISNSDFLCSHGGAYDSFHSSRLTFSEVRSVTTQEVVLVSTPSRLVPLPPNSSFYLRCRASEYSLRSAAAALQRGVGGVYSSLCRLLLSSCGGEGGGIEIRPCQSRSFVFQPLLAGSSGDDGLGNGTEKVQNPCQKFSFVALEMKSRQSFCHTANEHCQWILQNCSLVILTHFDTWGTRQKDEEVMTFCRPVGIWSAFAVSVEPAC